MPCIHHSIVVPFTGTANTAHSAHCRARCTLFSNNWCRSCAPFPFHVTNSFRAFFCSYYFRIIFLLNFLRADGVLWLFWACFCAYSLRKLVLFLFRQPVNNLLSISRVSCAAYRLCRRSYLALCDICKSLSFFYTNTVRTPLSGHWVPSAGTLSIYAAPQCFHCAATKYAFAEQSIQRETPSGLERK